jgi:alpha-galactosidase
MRSYVMTGLRGDRPLTPLVTYNTWYAYGTQITDETLRLEIGRAAALGVELFVVDAGWYTGADQSDPANFDQGLGTWEVDPIRFPSGLKPLRDYAHRLGLKFGIWVEPSRVNLSVVGHGGPDESWLATTAGSYGSDHSAQICLGGAVGRQWIVDRLSALIDAAEPDYLKWDNNLWMNCDRDGHDHGPTDGSFAHVTALYQMLEALHRRYPDLLIENCSAGGNRLDFAMLRYTDVAWMDDRTAPSVHVRHNIQGLSEVFPPAYLLAFVTDHQGESLHDARDLTLYVRSRMIGALGLGFRGDELVADEVSRIGREIATYKDLRGRLSTAAATLLSAQAALADGPDWDVVQAAGPSGDALVVYAYYNGAGASSVTVKPTGLRPEASYAVISVDVGVIGVATGDALMSNGLEVLASAASAAHILTLTAIP